MWKVEDGSNAIFPANQASRVANPEAAVFRSVKYVDITHYFFARGNLFPWNEPNPVEAKKAIARAYPKIAVFGLCNV